MKVLYIFPFILQTLVWIPTWIVLGFFTKFTVIGRDRLKGLHRNVIFVANHGSELDPILVPASLNPFSAVTPIFYVAREREFYNKNGLSKYIYGGLWFKLWGAYPAYSGRKDYGYSLQEHLKILKAGKSLLVFPEGGKSTDGSIGHGRGGAVFLSHETGVPIIPVAMRGHFGMNAKDFILRKRNITITYGKPLYVADLFQNISQIGVEDYKHAAHVVMSKLRELYKSSARESIAHGFSKAPVTR